MNLDSAATTSAVRGSVEVGAAAVAAAAAI
jgi:hypothetical protein